MSLTHAVHKAVAAAMLRVVNTTGH